jgi:hypothetical protein
MSFIKIIKKHLFVISLCLMASGVCGQSVTAINPPTTIYGGYNDTELEAAFDVQNTSANSVLVMARKEVVSQVAGTDDDFCWGGCYTGVVDSSDIGFLLEPFDITSAFQAHYFPQGNSGITTMKYCFYVDGTPGDEICVTINFDASSPNGIGELDGVELGQAYPNPAQSWMQIPYNIRHKNATMKILDATGREVKEFSLRSGQNIMLLNVEDLTEGIYFYTLETPSKERTVKKFVVYN